MARTGVRLTSPETYTTIWNMISNIDHRLPRLLTLLCAAALVSGSPGANQKTRASQRYAVIVAPLADPLELYAASELRKYLRALYGLDPALANSPDAESDGFFLIGNPRTNPETDAVAGATWPKVSDQGMVFRKAKLRGKPAFLLGGGSSQATLWAVYEFVQRAGVRFSARERCAADASRAVSSSASGLHSGASTPVSFLSRGERPGDLLVFYGMNDYRPSSISSPK